MKNLSIKFFLLLLSVLVAFSLYSCRLKDKGEEKPDSNNSGTNSDVDKENEKNFYIFNENTDAIIVLGDGVSAEDISAFLEAYTNLMGNMPSFSDAESFSGDHGIIFGQTETDLSKRGYTKLSRQDKTEYEEVGFVIYSDGKSVAICFDEDRFGLDIALNRAIDHFVNNYLQNKALSLRFGDSYEEVFNVFEKQKELDEATLASLWDKKLLQLKNKFNGDSELAEETLSALKNLHSIFRNDGDITSWIANLYDPENGGFYYSNSGRDNIGYLPDLESTTQALGIIEEMLSLDYGGTLADFLGEEIVSQLIAFAKGMQDPQNGYFYHPQWSKELTDQKLSRRGRDVGNAVRILSRFGVSPTYDTPTGVKGDGLLADGTPVSAKSLSKRFGSDAVIAVSSVLLVNAEDANVSAHMRTREAFEAYLASLDINGDYYSVGNTLESQADQFVQRDKVLEERGENYRLADICANWMTSHQNTETGLWNLDGLRGYEEVNGLLKLGSAYSKLGKKIPNAMKGLEAAIDCMLGDEVPEIICDIFNTWYAINTVSSNIQTLGTAAEYAEVVAIKDYVYQNFPDMVNITTEKVLIFKKLDGSYSFQQKYSSHTSQGMQVAVPNSVEGDVNATMIAAISIPAHIYTLLGIGKVPIFTTADRLEFQSIMADMGYIIKNEIPPATPIDFEDEKVGQASDYATDIINSSGSVLVAKRPDGKGKALSFISSADGSGVGSDEIQFSTNSSWLGAPCNVLELDMSVLEGTDETYFAQLSLYPNMYMLGIHRTGDTIWFTEESSWSAGNSFTYDLGVRAKVSEWFNLRIEFYTGTTDTLRIKIYFNDKCIVVSDNYFDAKADKLDGKGRAPQEYTMGRLLVMSTSNAEMLIDNVIVEQTYSSYEEEANLDKQPIRNVDAPDTEQKIYNFEEQNLPEGFAGNGTLNGNKLSIANGNSVSIPTHHRGGSANSAKVSFRLTVSEDSETGAKYAFNFKEFMNTEKTLIPLHLVVKEYGGQKYAVFCEANGNSTGIEYDSIKIPLGVEVSVDLYFFFNESQALVFIDDELIGINGNVVSGQRRMYYGNLVIESLTAARDSEILIDDLVSERIRLDYNKVSAPNIDRVTHEFDDLSGIPSEGIDVNSGALDLRDAANGGHVCIPVNSRANIATYGLVSLLLNRVDNSEGEFTVSFADRAGNVIASFTISSENGGIAIYEHTENGKYKTPIHIAQSNAFELSIEYSPVRESFNILISGECVAVSSLNYKKGSCDNEFEYAMITCDGASPFRITSAVCETSAALFKLYNVVNANEDSTAKVMTYETSSLGSLPSKITKSFVTSGASLSVREGILRGESSKVLEFKTVSGGNDFITIAPTKTSASFNAIAFETDMMITTDTGLYVDVAPMANGNTAYQIRFYVKPNGGNVNISSSDFSKNIAKEGQWFKFRFEYTNTEYDYNYDGKADIIMRVYVNDVLITEGYTPYYETGFDADTVSYIRFFTHSSSEGSIFFDNTSLEQYNMEYDAPEEYVPSDPTIIDYETGMMPSQLTPVLVSDNSDISIIKKNVGDEVTKVLKFTTSAGGNDYVTFTSTKNAESFNAVAFETDIMFSTTSPGFYVDIQPMADGKTAYQVRTYIKPNGGTINVSSSDFSTDIAKEGEWFRLRIEYANTEYDFNYDGKLDVLVRVYVNGVMVEEGYTPFYETGFDEEGVSVFRFFTHNSSAGDIYFDNTVFEQFTMEYEEPPVYVPEDPTILGFESGVLPSLVSFNKASANASFGIVENTVYGEVSKVLKFTTSKGGNDYFNVKVTDAIDGANAIRFETDIMISPNSNSQFAIEPLTGGSSRAFRLIVTAAPDGNVTVYSESEKSVSFTLGAAGEWAHLVIDYMATDIDYNYDGTADVFYKIYVGDSETPVAVGYAPYRAGDVYDASAIASYRFFAFSDADCDIFLDNTSLKKIPLTPDEAPEVEEPDEPETPIIPDVPEEPEEPEIPDVPSQPETPDDPEVSPETPAGPGHQDGENLFDPDGWGNR